MVEITSKAEIRSWQRCMGLHLTAHHCCHPCSLAVSSVVKSMANSKEVESMGLRATAMQTSQWHMWTSRAMEQKLLAQLAWSELRENWFNAVTTASTIISKTTSSEWLSSMVSKPLNTTPTIGTTCTKAKPTTIHMESILSEVQEATMSLQIPVATWTTAHTSRHTLWALEARAEQTMPSILSEEARITWMNWRIRAAAIKSDFLSSPTWTRLITSIIWTNCAETLSRVCCHRWWLGRASTQVVQEVVVQEAIRATMRGANIILVVTKVAAINRMPWDLQNSEVSITRVKI